MADFSKKSSHPAVLLKLYKENVLLRQQPLSQEENFTLDDTITAEVENIMIPYRSEGYEEPLAKIKLKLLATPEIKLHLISDKEAYEPGEEIRLSLIAENQGIEDAENLRINLSSQPELFHFHDGVSVLEAGNSASFGDGYEKKRIRFKAPLLPGPRKFQVKAQAAYFDKYEKEHQSAAYCIFTIAGQLSLHKSVEENMIPEKTYSIILSLRNSGANNFTVDLVDSVSEGFEVDADSKLKWNLNVRPGQTVTLSYNIRPKRPGIGFVLPAAIADYDLGNDGYEIRSEAPSVDVFGPFIEVNKRISSSMVNSGETIDVFVEVVNIGNRTIKAFINESIPGWARLREGRTRLIKLLNAGEKASLIYGLSCDSPGSYVLPETSVVYVDARGDQYNASSLSLQVEVLKKAPPANTTEAKAKPVQHNDSAINESLINSKGSLKFSSTSVYFLALSVSILACIYFLLGKIL